MEQTFLDRLKLERSELNEKTEKLTDFVTKIESFSKLSAANQNLLIEQLNVMNRYLGILDIRIELQG